MSCGGDLKRHKIGVIMGGISSEREISIRSGTNVYNELVNNGYNAVKIVIEKDYFKDIEKEKIDIAFIMLHGKYGEDGIIQSIFEIKKIPYTGCNVLSSAICMNKWATKLLFKSLNIPVAEGNLLSNYEKNNFKGIKYPAILKPIEEGSSIGVQKIESENKLKEIISEFKGKYKDGVLEKYIDGREITIGLYREEKDINILPILELKPKNEFYDFDAKYTKGKTDFIIPSPLKEETLNKIHNYVKEVYNSLSLSGVVRIDAMLDKEENPYFLEINTIPGMTETSDIPAMAKAANIPLIRILECMLKTALLRGCNV